MIAKELKTKITEYENKLKAHETNQSNADSTPGSLTGNGPVNDVISEATIEAHANDVAWMKNNYNRVAEFYAKKKG